jgi:HSP20 family protein
MFDGGVGRLADGGNGYDEMGAYTLGVDVAESQDGFVVKAAVPGMKPEDVDISVENDVLTIRGQHKQEQTREDENYLRRELRWGSFERALRLPPTVDAERADAKFDNGVLTVTLPKKPEAQPRKIQISGQQMIEGEKSGQRS